MTGSRSVVAGAKPVVGIASEWIGERVGGLERYATHLIRSLIRQNGNHRYSIFVTPRGARELAKLGVDGDFTHQTRFNSRWYYVPFGLPLAVSAHRVDLLHATFSVVPWCPPRSVVLTVHDVCPDVHPEFFPRAVRLRFRWLLAAGARRAERIIVPSDATRRELLAHYPVDDGKIVTIPEGVDHPFAPPVDSAAPSAIGWMKELGDYALYVGRFHARKNLDRLLSAFSILKRRGRSYKLVLAGRDMWEGRRIQERIHSLQLQSDVVCPGYVTDEELEGLYRRARVFVFPSLHEGFGLPPLEAMARGVPVMASNVSSLPEVLGDAALLADPRDEESMADALDRLMCDEALRELYARRGRERARSFTWSAAARSTSEVYEEVLCSR